MTRIPPALRRRLDAMARGAHAFHRFAHHPLCGAYEGEVFRLGRRTRICRGCTLLGSGLAAGAVLGLIVPGGPPVFAAAGVAGAVLAGLALARRLPKSLGRFAPAMLLALAFSGSLASGAMALALLPALLLGALLALYRRRGPDRSPCLTCPARTESPCPGYAPMVRRERAFQRLSGSLVARATR